MKYLSIIIYIFLIFLNVFSLQAPRNERLEILELERDIKNEKIRNKIEQELLTKEMDYKIPTNFSRDGEYKIYLSTGELRATLNYKNKKKNGEEIWFYASGDTVSIKNYKNNRLHGEAKIFSRKIKGDNHTSYYVDSLIHFSNGKKDGPFKCFYLNNIQVEANYKNGKKSGIENLYFYDNTIRTIRIWKNDTLNGTTKEYHHSGFLIEEIEYNKGLKHGIAKHYYSSGIVNFSTHWRNNKKHGEQNFYYNNGKLQSTITWDNGIPIEYQHYTFRGLPITPDSLNNYRSYETEYYNSDSNSIKKETFRKKRSMVAREYSIKGDLILYTSFHYDNEFYTDLFYTSGALKSHSQSSNKKNRVTKKEFYESGKLFAISIYVNKKLHGEKKAFYEDGSVQYIGQFDNGKMLEEEYFKRGEK